MRKLFTFSLITAITIISFKVMGQPTMPTLKDLSLSDFSFNAWASTEPAGTYPENMYFHRSSTQDPGLSVEMTTNYTASYNLTSGTRINGMGDDGITFVNTSGSGNLGAAVVGLNTSGRTNVQVSWLGGTHTQTDGNRIYAIRLQYRIGNGAWTDVPGPVEYSSSGQTAGHTQNFGPTTLPAACDNQPAVYLRWKYYSVSGSSGTRPRLRLDEISVTSTPSVSNSISTGTVSTPPFCVNTSNSASGTVDYSATGTYSSSTFTAYLSDASGSFASPTAIGSATVSGNNPSGSINITIPAGTPSGTGYKIRIDSDSPAVTGSESTNFEIVNGANNVTSPSANPNDQQVTLSWTNPSGCYNEIMIVARQGSAVSATPSGDGTAYTANLNFGSGTSFDGGYVVYKGTSSPKTVTNLTNGQEYYFTFFTRNGTDWSSGVTVSSTPNPQPTLVEIILPQYIQGLNGTNNNRLPFAFRATLTNLLPNATYRYFNQAVTSSDDLTTNGAGNCIFANPGGFVKTTGPSLATSGNYGEFTTNASGSYTGWFIFEPSGNARFTPGNQVYMRIMLNDGAGGTSVATRLTSTNYVTVINFGTNNVPTEGSGFYSSSYSPAKNFVFLYDNVLGNGRPLTGTFVEDDGSTGGTNYIGFYQTNVDGQNGKWGVIIPNTTNGVKRIAYHDITTGNLLYYQNDTDGTWGATNTVNPTNGSTAAEIPYNDADEMSIAAGFNIDLVSGQTLTVGSLTSNNMLTLEDGASLICGSSTGAITIKRNMSGNNQYHLISSPVTGAVVGTVFPEPQHNTVWLRQYDEPTGTWINKFAADIFETGKGYSMVTTDAGTQATFAGTLVNTDQNMTLSYLGTSGNSNYDGWNLLGNPFSSAIDRDLGTWNPTNVEPAVYVFDNGNYRSWNSGGTLTDGIIPMGQGFFMKAQVNNGTVTIPEGARVHSNQAFYKSSPVNTLRVDVSNSANSYTDALVIRYTEGATAQYDASFDARKLSGLFDAPEIWCPGDVPTSLNSLPSIEQQPEVTIAFKPAAPTMHTLSFSGIESFDYTGPIMLTDLVTGSRIDIRSQATYEYMASPADPENRFKLTFASVGIDEPQALNGVNAWYQEGAIRLAQLPATPCQAELYSTDGKLLLSARVMPTQNQIPVSLKSAVYILRLFDGNQVRNIKFIVK